MGNNVPIFQYRFTFKRIILFPVAILLSGTGFFLVFLGQSNAEKLLGICSISLFCLSAFYMKTKYLNVFSDRIEIPKIFSSQLIIIPFFEIQSVKLESRKYPPAGLLIDHGSHTWINPDFISKKDRDALIEYFKAIGKVKD